MSGHSKWSTIKRKKGANDAKRGKIFTKLIKEVTVAVRMGGGPDVDSNPRLRLVIDKCRANNMPNDNIKRAIKKASGDVDGANYEEQTFEGYGPGGVAVMVETLSDNKNRTTSEVRHAFSKYGGNLGTNGCVAHLFDKKGMIVIESEGVDEDALMELAIESGAEDMKNEGETFEVYTDPADFETVRDAVKEGGYNVAQAEVSWIPQTTVELSGKQASSMLKMIELLEDLDDVQDVWSNFDMDEDEMEAMNN